MKHYIKKFQILRNKHIKFAVSSQNSECHTINKWAYGHFIHVITTNTFEIINNYTKKYSTRVVIDFKC